MRVTYLWTIKYRSKKVGPNSHEEFLVIAPDPEEALKGFYETMPPYELLSVTRTHSRVWVRSS